MTVVVGWRWKIAIAFYIGYMTIARYCDFKLAIGLATTACGCN